MVEHTKHSLERCHQRGFDPLLAHIINAMGIVTRSDSGGDTIELSKREKKDLVKRLKRLVRACEGNPYIVCSNDGHVITVAHHY
ncbi:hypothetical protein [Vibrio hippocampi]|uniref:Uncharacterized protein n=1 Tax=Vibrio hippocampi TaxID=654686 RepID=A0ABM8ZFR5_9VIBR|nr:hypothetical protein [Vibrio hippocampi]CAH0525418.1 hypothetical protein VHP8226_00965 [Vibrio hippocampi]